MVKSFIGENGDFHVKFQCRPLRITLQKLRSDVGHFNLISKAYTSIPVSLAESYLGLPRDELLPSMQSPCPLVQPLTVPLQLLPGISGSTIRPRTS
jgi:hypothetical protein